MLKRIRRVQESQMIKSKLEKDVKLAAFLSIFWEKNDEGLGIKNKTERKR